MLQSILKAGIFWSGLLLSLISYAQDPIFGFRDPTIGIRPNEPLGTMPMQYIPSFAGEAGAPRLTLNTAYGYRNIPDLFREQIIHTALSYDQFIPGLRTGIGFYAHTNSGRIENFLNPSSFPLLLPASHYLSLDIAPKLSIKGKYTLSPAVNLHYIKSKNKHYPNSGGQGFGSRTSLMWNAPKYYIGFSMSGITAYQARSSTNIPSHFYSYLQAGYTFQKSSEADFSVTPQLVLLLNTPNNNRIGPTDMYKNKLDRYVEAFNLNFRYKQFIWGVNNAGIHLGFQNERLRLMLTNDSGYFGEGYFGRRGRGYLQDSKHYKGNLSMRYVFK